MALPRKVRILIVDDSAVMRSLLKTVVGTDARLEVAGAASDGASAIRAMDSLRPDLILLDVEMPGMDGLSTLKEMKARGSRIPVIMCSSLTQRGAKVTIEALASGAADYVAKPAGQASLDMAVQALGHELIPKIVALAASQTAAMGAFRSRRSLPWDGASASRHNGTVPSQLEPSHTAQADRSSFRAQIRTSHVEALSQLEAGFAPAVVVIGVSTGGPAALDVVLPALPASFLVPVLVVQHMPELFTRMLAERLDSRCPLRVVEASHGEAIRPGTVYIAKGDWHLEVALASPVVDGKAAGNSGGAHPCARLTQQPPENHCRPAADVLFRSAVSVYGSQVLAVVLTGMGSDGLLGCRRIHERSGGVLVQDQPSSAVWGMPGAVAQAGLAHRILPLNRIAPEILRLAGRGQREAFALRESVV